MSDPTTTLTPDELTALCASAIEAAGGSPEIAATLAAATVSAELRGKTTVGASHLLDYIEALEKGRINGHPGLRTSTRSRAVTLVDADSGTAQLAFAHSRDEVVATAREFGLAMLSITHSYTAGELGYYTRWIAEHGLIGLAGTNSPALMSLFSARSAVTGTNPLAFSLPLPGGVRSFDQAASATAWVSVRAAAEAGGTIPEGWALGPDGSSTQDPAAALAGALLPAGGVKGSNIALMVEMLAVLGGANFSLDAPPFDRGDQGPGIGLFLLAIDPGAVDPEYCRRAEAHLDRLEADHGIGFGRTRVLETIAVPSAVLDRLNERVARPHR